jgi:mono/diheme cytochrome c family protein
VKSQVMAVGALVFLPFSSFAQNPKEQPDRPARLIDSLQGPDLYKGYCAVCHGSDAKGNGPLAKWLRTAPADLTRIASRNGGSLSGSRAKSDFRSGIYERGARHA